MFSIPLIHYNVDRWLYKRNKLLDLIPHDAMTLGDETVVSNYQGANNQCALIQTILEDEIKLFNRQLNCNAQIVRAWFEQADNSMFHPPHTHGHGGWSAVLFLTLIQI